MASLPENLQPIPTQPWDKRPDSLPLDVEECRTALWKYQGNVTNAAKHLKISPARMRTFIKKSPYLTREMQEAKEMMLDKAEENIWDALESDDDVRRDSMTKFVYNTFGRLRGFGQGASSKVEVNTGGGNVVITWADGNTLGQSSEVPNTIEGEIVDGE